MILLALAGPAGAGKSTAAKLLVERAGFTRISFAAPLYDMLAAGGFGRPTTLEEKQAIIPGLGFSWRHAAQTLGTEWGRKHLGDDIWVDLALRKASDPNGRYVIDDCRFENEAAKVRACGGTVVHLLGRSGNIGVGTYHASEKGVGLQPDCDYILNNDKDGMTHLSDSLANMLYAVVQG
jgi:hypothetical protein